MSVLDKSDIERLEEIANKTFHDPTFVEDITLMAQAILKLDDMIGDEEYE